MKVEQENKHGKNFTKDVTQSNQEASKTNIR